MPPVYEGAMDRRARSPTGRTERACTEPGKAIAATARTAGGAGASHVVCDRRPRLAIWGDIVEDVQGGEKARSSGSDIERCRVDQVESTKCGVCVGMLEDVERLVRGHDELERICVLVDHDDGEGVVGGAPEQEDVDPVRRAIGEL